MGHVVHRMRTTALKRLMLVLAGATSSAYAQTPVPFVASRWAVDADTQFVAREGFPQGLLVMKGASEKSGARLNGLDFGDGTIEFDMKPIGADMPGVVFHRRDADTAEEFYVRVSPDCPASLDCLQYAPRFQGRMLWDTYYQYQHAAPVSDTGWSHLKLVISGKRMNVYVNRSASPSLSVDELQGDASHGGIQLQGPAMFANLVIAPGAVDGLSPRALPDAAHGDPRYVNAWDVTPPALLAEDAVAIGAMPGADAKWQRVHAGRGGLVNLARRFPHTHAQPPLVAWLKTSMTADKPQTRRVSLGFLRVVSVFVNGKLAFTGKNTYNVPGGRRPPDGRLGLDNASFDLPLQKGRNDIVVALRSNTPDMRDQYGFGMQFRLDDAHGIQQRP